MRQAPVVEELEGDEHLPRPRVGEKLLIFFNLVPFERRNNELYY